MKRKLLFILALSAALICLLAISVSADSVTTETEVTLLDGTSLPLYDESGEGLIWYVYSTDENGVNTYASVSANDNTKDNATSYVTYKINSQYGKNQMHDIYINHWNAETSQYESINESKIVVINLRTFQQEYWSFGSIFNGSYLEYVYHGATVRSSGGYKEYKKLQLIDMSLSTSFESFPAQAFWGCSNLKTVRLASGGSYALDCQNSNLFNGCAIEEIIIPDCVTGIGGAAFANCTSLKRVVISENSQITYFSDTSFASCTSLTYFYLPPLLERAGYSTDSTKGCFKNCTSLYFVNNPEDTEKPEVYYFPANFGKPLEDGTSTITYRAFNNVPLCETVVLGQYFTKIYDVTFGDTNVQNVVCLGEMTEINYLSGKNPTIYLCNSNQTSTDGINLKNSSRYSCVVCNAEGNETHLYKVEVNTVPSCTEGGSNGFECFCGKPSEDTVLLPALGHEKNELLAKYFVSVNGTLDYYNDMVTEHSCTRCEATVYDTEKGSALFTKKGYSYSQDDASTLSYTVYVNTDAIKAYNPELLYGIVVSASVSGAPISFADGALSYGDKTIAVEFQNTEVSCSVITAKLTGIGDGVELHLSAYCVDNGAVSYLGHDTVSTLAETVSHEALLTKHPDGKQD